MTPPRKASVSGLTIDDLRVGDVEQGGALAEVELVGLLAQDQPLGAAQAGPHHFLLVGHGLLHVLEEPDGVVVDLHRLGPTERLLGGRRSLVLGHERTEDAEDGAAVCDRRGAGSPGEEQAGAGEHRADDAQCRRGAAGVAVPHDLEDVVGDLGDVAAELGEEVLLGGERAAQDAEDRPLGADHARHPVAVGDGEGVHRPRHGEDLAAERRERRVKVLVGGRESGLARRRRRRRPTSRR